MSRRKAKAKVETPSHRDEVRKKSAYGNARELIGIPFLISGIVCFAASGIGALVVFGSDNQLIGFREKIVLLVGVVAPVGILGLFLYSIPALAGAIFDIADCALRSDAREQAKAAKATYDEYRRNQQLLE